MTNLYLIRHAKSEANVRHVYGTDTSLSEEGRTQAKKIAETIQIVPDIVISGSKKRQIQTAEILFPDVYKHDATSVFDEICFGELEGTPISDKIDSDVVKDILSIKTVYHGDNVWERAEAAIKYISKMGIEHPDKTIAVISSDTLIQSVITLLQYGVVNGVIWAGKYYIPNCTPVRFTIKDDGKICDIYLPDKELMLAAIKARYGENSEQCRSFETYNEYIILEG